MEKKRVTNLGISNQVIQVDLGGQWVHKIKNGAVAGLLVLSCTKRMGRSIKPETKAKCVLHRSVESVNRTASRCHLTPRRISIKYGSDDEDALRCCRKSVEITLELVQAAIRLAWKTGDLRHKLLRPQHEAYQHFYKVRPSRKFVMVAGRRCRKSTLLLILHAETCIRTAGVQTAYVAPVEKGLSD